MLPESQKKRKWKTEETEANGHAMTKENDKTWHKQQIENAQGLIMLRKSSLQPLPSYAARSKRKKGFYFHFHILEDL